MVWRTVVIENPARLSLRDNQLAINVKDLSSPATVPLEDLATLIVDNSQIALTAPLLTKLASCNSALIVCDEKHIPSGLFLPLNQHHRTTEVLNFQIESGSPFCKRCWQSIVVQKIENQAAVLSQLARDGCDQLLSLAKKVTSGDSANIEAQAAKIYWTNLFGPPFRRSADTTMNAALNYGYAIVRAAVARGIVARGLNPAIGIHHKSKLNGFNLADDLIEPLRPIVDRFIAETFLEQSQEFDTDLRHRLIDLINSELYISKKSLSVLRVIEVVASSFVDALRDKNHKLLQMPTVEL